MRSDRVSQAVAALVVVPAALAAGACASPASVGQVYRDAGKPELAVLYLARAYHEDPEDPERAGALREALELAARNLDLDYEARVREGALVAALGVALRKLELASFATAIGIGGLDPAAAEKRVTEVAGRAASQTLRRLDEAEAGNAPPAELLRLLREARAHDPNDPEINARYADLQRRLQRRVAVRLDCPAEASAACRQLADRVLARITELRRELLVVVPESSDRKDLELVVSLSTQRTQPSWRRVGGGVAQKSVPKMNQYAEPATTKDGKPILERVSARWEMFESTSAAALRGRVRLDDLRQGAGDVLSREVHEQRSSKAAYYTWDGDFRALDPGITRVGTDQTPPQDPELLLLEAVRAAGDQIAPLIIETLEQAPAAPSTTSATARPSSGGIS